MKESLQYFAISVQPIYHYFPWVSKEVDTLSPPPESVQSGDTPFSREWVLVGVADSSQLGTPERTREFEKLKDWKTEHGATTVAN